MGILAKIINRPSKQLKLLKINFSKPWWDIFYQQRWMIAGIIFMILLGDGFNTLLPFFLGKAIETSNPELLLTCISLFVAVNIACWFTYFPWMTKLDTQTYDSFRFNAFKYLLAIDPIYHVNRPSGTVVGKIHRTSNAFLDLNDVVLDGLLPFAVESTVVIISMFLFDITLGFLVLGIVLFIGFVYSFISIKYSQSIELKANKQDDIVHQKNMESLTQLHFIRSTFATDYIKAKLRSVHLDVMRSQTTLWMSYRIIRGIFVSFYWISLGGITLYLIHLVNLNLINPVVATSLIIIYMRGTKGVFKISRYIQTLTKSYRLIQDFYGFIRVFGQQTYPIFEDDLEKTPRVKKQDETSIQMIGVTFAYPGQPDIFKNNSIDLKILKRYKNKLFGLIGPSGIGKTTILSILGGQLRPEEGQVIINSINIYEVDDDVRRRLIALQGQVATSMRGTLKYNLLFGLPEKNDFDDKALIEILDNVGLWKLFSEKEGLKTFIGESGLNLSGGQRQRLNFANLYLRAKFYKPLLILIDEPTSSLDEISERAITDMIEELAGVSVTFVIAHRLKTLEDAYEILDFSLIKPGSTLQFYKPDKLKTKS